MKRIVTIGGGTGSYTVLSGLKKLKNVSLTALVSMADDGGSTGKLRKNWHVMPMGDVRQCLVALTGQEFLNYRFNFGFLKGHKIGNIFLAFLEKITGDFTKGLKILSWLFRAVGEIVPITKDEAILCVKLKDGIIITGENNITVANLQTQNNEDNIETTFYKGKVKLNPIASEAILKADYIIIGPGNIYSSIVPNFIVNDFFETIQKSKAKIIFLINLVNQPGHTMGYSSKKHIDNIEKYLGKKVDFILINKEPFSNLQYEHYLKDAGIQGENIFIIDDYQDERIIRAGLLSSKIVLQNKNDMVKRSLIRHDSDKIAKVIREIIEK